MKYSFPNMDDWVKIAEKQDYSRLKIDTDKICKSSSDISYLLLNIDLQNWGIHLINRIGDILKSHIFLLFYFKDGFPDENWFQSPGPEGQSVSYFQSFSEDDFCRKDMFDFLQTAFSLIYLLLSIL